MRLLLVTHYWYPEYGPDPPILGGNAHHFIEQGVEVDVLASQPSYPGGIVEPPYRGKIFLRETIEGLATLRTWTFSASRTRPRRQRLNELSFGLSSLLAAPLLRRRYDWVLVLSPPLLLLPSAWLLSRLLGAKLALQVMDLHPQCAIDTGALSNGLEARFLHRIARFAYRRAALVLTASNGYREGVVAEGTAPEKVHFIPNGIDTTEMRPLPPSFAAQAGDRNRSLRAVFAGSMSRQHDIASILDSAEMMLQEGDETWEFHLVGAGSRQPWAADQVRQRGLDNVHVSPPVPRDEMSRLLGSADVVLVSLIDLDLCEKHLPTKIYDAMACGRPILLSGRGEPRDLVERAGAGIAVPPENPKARVAALRLLEADPELRRRLGDSGREFAERELNRSRIADRILQLLRNPPSR